MMHAVCQRRCWKMSFVRATLFLFIVFVNANADDTSLSLSKQSSRERRGGSNKFLGMRGKKFLCGTGEPCVNPLLSDESLEVADGGAEDEQAPLSNPFEDDSSMLANAFFNSNYNNNYIKRQYQGFAALRGKRYPQLNTRDLLSSNDHFNDDNNMQLFLEAKRGRSKGFVGMRGKKQPLDGDQKRGPDSGRFFAAMRGKRPKSGPNAAAFFGVRGKRSLTKQVHGDVSHQ